VSAVLSGEGLAVRYGSGRAARLVVDDVSLELAEGLTLGLVGESGSGKSTVARALVGLAPLRDGTVRVDGDVVDVRRRRGRARLRASVQLVFQNPQSSLNPRMTVAELVGEAVRAHRALPRRALGAEVRRLLELVTLDAAYAARYTHELSGGQRQRVALARALATEPRALIADEITSALDVSVQAAVLNLLRRLQAELGLSMLFISHDLAVVRNLCDAVVVMRHGRVVERGACGPLFDAPSDPYTKALLDAVPRMHTQSPTPTGSPR